MHPDNVGGKFEEHLGGCSSESKHNEADMDDDTDTLLKNPIFIADISE